MEAGILNVSTLGEGGVGGSPNGITGEMQNVKVIP